MGLEAWKIHYDPDFSKHVAKTRNPKFTGFVDHMCWSDFQHSVQWYFNFTLLSEDLRAESSVHSFCMCIFESTVKSIIRTVPCECKLMPMFSPQTSLAAELLIDSWHQAPGSSPWYLFFCCNLQVAIEPHYDVWQDMCGPADKWYTVDGVTHGLSLSCISNLQCVQLYHSEDSHYSYSIIFFPSVNRHKSLVPHLSRISLLWSRPGFIDLHDQLASAQGYAQ